QDHDDPDEGEYAVFELTHQPGKDNLREEGDGRAGNPDDEGDEGLALGIGGLVIAAHRPGQPARPRGKARAQSARQHSLRSFDDRHHGYAILASRANAAGSLAMPGLTSLWCRPRSAVR